MKGDTVILTGTATTEGAQWDLSFLDLDGDYRVVGTDYQNYALVYACKDHLGITHDSHLWVYSKD